MFSKRYKEQIVPASSLSRFLTFKNPQQKNKSTTSWECVDTIQIPFQLFMYHVGLYVQLP